MQASAALIAGTGIADLLERLGGRPALIPTCYGPARGRFLEVQGKTLFLVKRHSVGHKVPPHAVNYRAAAEACRRLGVRSCFATAAVGSLRADWPAGTIVVPDDFIDATARNITMHDRRVEHVDFSDSLPLGGLLRMIATNLGTDFQPKGVYVGGNGPRYETPAEVRAFGHIGDVVGMTASSEAVCFGEVGIPYGLICVVTNLGTGLSGTLSHGEVVDVMKAKGPAVLEILLKAVEKAG